MNLPIIYRFVALVILPLSAALYAPLVQAQSGNPLPAILTTPHSSVTGQGNDRVVVFPNANASPPTQKLVPGLPDNVVPHGVSYFGSDSALVADWGNSRIFVLQISSATLLATINTASVGYDGTGTIAVAPNLKAALAMGTSGSDTKLYVIQSPFKPSSMIDPVTLPGSIRHYQTQGIVFNNAGRAFVYTTAGISVLDPPYNSVAFTIPVGNANSGAIAITPDGNTLLSTFTSGNQVSIYHAPFTASASPEFLTISGGNALDGIMVTPDGGKAIVVSVFAHQAAAISAPFSSSSTVQTLPLPPGNEGFEDVGISANSQLAILAGESGIEPPIFIRAPFTAAGAQSFNVPIQNASNGSRGAGAVRFQPPGLAPGLTISKTAAASVLTGTDLTYTISYRNTGIVNATNVVIRDPVPAGTAFASASIGGALQGNTVVFNIGAVMAGAGPITVSASVHVTAAAGATITNSSYTIEATGVAPIPGPPVTTSVTGPPPLINISTRLQVLTNDNVLIGGVIVTATQPKSVLFRALGPTLGLFNVHGALADPTMELHDTDSAGHDVIVATNDNWKIDGQTGQSQEAAIVATGKAPPNALESAILQTVTPGNYTVIVRGKNNTTGVGLIEAYDVTPSADAQLFNISSRGLVGTGDNVMIGGFIVGATSRFLVRGLGPTLGAPPFNVPGVLADPTLELHDGSGNIIATNDNWKTNDQTGQSQEVAITDTGKAPPDDAESALLQTLSPGNYTAILRGKNNTTGVALVEVYNSP